MRTTHGTSLRSVDCRPHTMGLVLLVLVFSICGQDLKRDIESQFLALKMLFDQAAENPAIKSPKLSHVDKFFVSLLRKNQTFSTLIRTNSKGVVINEVVRGQKPVRTFRDVSNQEWYRSIATRKSEYNSFVLEDNGRYYLFWSKPYFLTNDQKFGGALMVKIDLWDCFHKFSADTDIPFLARLSKKSLYSHKWKEEITFREERLDIPGAQTISLRYPLAVSPVDTPSRADTDFASVSSGIVPIRAEEPARETARTTSPLSAKRNNSSPLRFMVVIVAAAVFVLLFLFLSLQLVFRIRSMTGAKHR